MPSILRLSKTTLFSTTTNASPWNAFEPGGSNLKWYDGS